MSERIDANQISVSCLCITCYYWYFLGINSRSQPKVCNGCDNLKQKEMSFNVLQLFLLKEMIIEFIFSMSQDEAKKLI